MPEAFERAKKVSRAFLLTLPFVIGGCIDQRIPEARVTKVQTPAWRSKRIVALPTMTVATKAPPSEVTSAIDAAIRMDLELHGLVLVDSEPLNATLRERVERTARWMRADEQSRWQHESTTVEVGPGSFTDSDRGVQERMMNELEIDTLLTSRLSFGRLPLPSATQSGPVSGDAVVLELTLTRRSDERVVARSVCRADVHAHPAFEAAVERTARCAVDGLLVAIDKGPRR
jgi:hypothetical protein